MYYRSNAMYEYLNGNPDNRFFYVSSDLWMLVYGNQNCDPQLLVLVSGVNDEDELSSVSEREGRAYKIMSELSEKSEVPVVFIRFSVNVESIDSIMLFNQKIRNFLRLNLADLRALFSRYGLPISKSPTAKYLNDKESSAYHKWQRTELGHSLRVSDIDLVSIKNREICKIYELKRSYYSLESWVPFNDDYNNFVLLSKLSHKAKLQLLIAYNKRTKNPWEDDISKIKLFEFNHAKRIPVTLIGYYTLKEFLDL